MFSALFLTLFQAHAVSVSISNQGLSDQIKFSEASEWEYKITKAGKNKIVLNISGELSSSSKNKIIKWKGKKIKKIKLQKNGDSNILEFTINPGVSYFDYQTDQPSSLILDFFKEKTKKKNVTKAKPKPVVKTRKPASEFLKFTNFDQKIGKSLAEKRKVFDAADKDYNRLKISSADIDFNSINSNVENDIFIKFPILINSSNQLEKMIKESPLHFISKKKNRESQTAQLLLKLYQAESWAAFDKLFSYYFSRFPDSKYENILRSIAISAFFKAWRKTGKKALFDKSESNFLKLQKKLKDHDATEFWSKIIFYSYLQLGRGYKAAELGEQLLKEYPEADDIENIKLSLAESYLVGAQYENAEKIYRELASSSPDPEVRKHAAYATPIIYLKKNKNQKAIQTYLNENKKTNGNFDTGYYFNLAESYFWNGEYKKSAEFYRSFISKFPDHENVSYALTRIAEIMKVLGLGKEKYEPIFFESVYRFPNIVGSDIAQIRLDSFNWDAKKEKEVKKNLEEINRISKKYPNEEFQYFRDIVVADSFYKKGDFKRSNKNLEKAFREKPFSKLAKGLKPRIIRNLKGQIDRYLGDGDYLKAMEIFEDNRLSWLSSIEDTNLKKSLAMTFEQAGLVEHAIAQYLNYASDLKEKNKEVEFPVALSLARLNLKLKNYDDMDKSLLRIKDIKNLKSAQKFEIVKMKAKVFADKFRFDEATAILNSFINLKNTKNPEKIKASIILSDLYLDRAQYKKALKTLFDVEESVDMEADNFISFRKRIAKLLLNDGRTGDALAELKRLSNHKKFTSDDSFVFFTGNAFLENGEEERGLEILERLKSKNGIYAKMISERMNHKKWQSNYGQFMDRIPAMENVQKGDL